MFDTRKFFASLILIGFFSWSSPLIAAIDETVSSVDRYEGCSATDDGSYYTIHTSIYLKAIDVSMLPPKYSNVSNLYRTFTIALFTASGSATALKTTDWKKVSASYNGFTYPGYRTAGATTLPGGFSFSCGDFMHSCAEVSNMGAHRADMEILIDKKLLNGRGIAIRAGVGNLMPSNNYFWDSAGSVYISPYDGSCKVIGPNFPTLPPEELTFSLRVPDWDLGEITPATQSVMLTKPEERLCIDFPGMVAGNTTDYVMNATSASMTASEFNLMNATVSGNKIPYRLTLDDGKGSQYTWPGNARPIAFSKDGTDQICLAPTFSILNNVGKFAPGQYKDVINFNIAAKA